MASWANDCAVCLPSLLTSLFSLSYGSLHIAQGGCTLFAHVVESLEKHGRCEDAIETGDLSPGSLTCRGSCSQLAMGLLWTWACLRLTGKAVLWCVMYSMVLRGECFGHQN